MYKFIRIALVAVLCFVLATPAAFAFVEDSTQTLVNTFVPGTGVTPGPGPGPGGEDEVVYVSVAVQKVVYNAGETAIGPEGFHFVLENRETGDGPVIESAADGWAQFLLEFDSADVGKTFEYMVYEINDGRENVTYSTQTYSVVVTVGYDGALTATVTVNGEENAVAVFRNVYDDGSVPPPPTGDKANLLLYAAMMAGGVVGLRAVLPRKRREEGDHGL